jgi:hypothetical protein
LRQQQVQLETEAAINPVQCELEETIKHRMEGVLACVDQRTQDLRKEQPLDARTKSLQETLADRRKDLHEELGIMFQVDAQPTKALFEASRRKFQMQLK